MKATLAFCVSAWFGAALAPIYAQDSKTGKLSDTERAYLVEQLELSKNNLVASISGLTDAQWRFKPAPEVWSVAECAEHIILAEDYFFDGEQQVLKSPAVARPATSNSQVDRALVHGALDRSKKATAPEPITPTGTKYPTAADAIREFTARRDKHISYAKTTNDDLRVHVTDGPFGPMDAYQFLLLMAAHSGRHTLQIREVEGNPEYPKTSGRVVFE